ncbi:hypothetical protein GLAREA_00968 [Glarea lozoyensis ATCC 20868]|uniref:2EXR domain-containing protein n=1 Tax=Glarea lozoyensis (strain ATCC 20868 / MF5171) TaxID=1116229 RepID=S3DTV6_GLAL2|nr:uncharacterized protein GLAREA_00968 [Glarea lozoyensis ATCC 20868]EPE29808.1 hypothetical protein GLAREA_00968 [Glarea lozoyensis ATCC 20868]
MNETSDSAMMGETKMENEGNSLSTSHVKTSLFSAIREKLRHAKFKHSKTETTNIPEIGIFRFTDLPIEIQFKILHLTYEPQKIVIWRIHNSFAGNIPRNLTPAPVALQINHALRMEAMKYYELLKYEGPPGKSFEKWPRIYINMDMDRLTLGLRSARLNTLSNHLVGLTHRVAREAGTSPSTGEPIPLTFPKYLPLLSFVNFISADQRRRLIVLFQDLTADLLVEIMCSPFEHELNKLLAKTRGLMWIMSEKSKSHNEDFVNMLVGLKEEQKQKDNPPDHHVIVTAGRLNLGIGFVSRLPYIMKE